MLFSPTIFTQKLKALSKNKLESIWVIKVNRMHRYINILLFQLIFTSFHAQNTTELIPNFGFEQTTSCGDTIYSNSTLVDAWFPNSNFNTIYNSCLFENRNCQITNTCQTLIDSCRNTLNHNMNRKIYQGVGSLLTIFLFENNNINNLASNDTSITKIYPSINCKIVTPLKINCDYQFKAYIIPAYTTCGTCNVDSPCIYNSYTNYIDKLSLMMSVNTNGIQNTFYTKSYQGNETFIYDTSESILDFKNLSMSNNNWDELIDTFTADSNYQYLYLGVFGHPDSISYSETHPFVYQDYFNSVINIDIKNHYYPYFLDNISILPVGYMKI